MKRLLFVLLLFPLLSFSQEVTKTSRGYIKNYDDLYLSYDTINNVIQGRSFFKGKYYYTIRLEGVTVFRQVLITFNQPFTIPYKEGTIVVTKGRRFKKTYWI